MLKTLSCIFRITFLATIILSCSTPRPEGKTEAEVLYKEAKQYIDEHLYDLARQRLNKLRSKFSYSFYATEAELLQADILFEEEKYAEAAAAYEVFRDFHPEHKKIHYVLYRIAESYYQQLPSTYDRDLTPAKEGIKYYQELLRQYPNSEYAKQAEEKIAECQEMLRNKQKYIADFYYRTEVYDSARYRYLDILKSFSEQDLRDHAMIRVVKASARMEKFEECRRYFQEYKKQISSSSQEALDKAAKRCRVTD